MITTCIVVMVIVGIWLLALSLRGRDYGTGD